MALDIWRAGPQPRKTVVRLDGKVSDLLKPVSRLEARVPVSGLPRTLLDTSVTEWQVIQRGRWQNADSIELGEGRATLHLLELLACCPGTFRLKVFALEDSSSWGGAASSGRSPAPALNYLCRRKAALSLAMRWNLLLPWMQSADVLADEASRLLPY